MIYILFSTAVALTALISVNTAWSSTPQAVVCIPAIFVAVFISINIVFALLACLLSFFVKKAPVEKQNAMAKFWCRTIAKLLCEYFGVKAEFEGFDKISEKNFLWVSNHRSGFDPLIIMGLKPELNISFISKPSNFNFKPIGFMAEGIGCLTIDRENNREALKTILTASDYIKKGICSIGIYPEGHRSKTGELLPFHNGSFKIAEKAKCPVVVAAISGSENVMKNFPLRKTEVKISVLEVIDTERVSEMKTAEMSPYVRTMIGDFLEGRSKDE